MSGHVTHIHGEMEFLLTLLTKLYTNVYARVNKC